MVVNATNVYFIPRIESVELGPSEGMWGFINLLGRFVDVPSLTVEQQILGLD